MEINHAMKFTEKPMFKMLAVGMLVLLLLIPANLVQNLIRERESTQNSAISEITSIWGGDQMIVGPYVSIPFLDPITVTNEDGSKTVSYARKNLHILPEVLDGAVDIVPENRSLGIYEAIVYEGDMKFSGRFVLPDFATLGIQEKYIEWNKAVVNMGVTDLRGVEGSVDFTWNDEVLEMNSGLSSTEIYPSGIHASVFIEKDKEYNFNISSTLRGSNSFSVVPFGKQTKFSMNSPWQEPSFKGSYATTAYTPASDGFKATWEVSHLNRNYPQAWSGRKYNPTVDFFGTEFIQSVDTYSKTNRVTKYAILTIALTFMVFYFSELINASSVNALQYVLIGLALVLFYTLLLSFSEHLGFNYAYLLAAVMTVMMEFFYAKSVLKSSKLAGYVAGVLSLLYTFIFVLIQLKDFALVAGSLGLFAILGGIMYISRNIEWNKDYSEV